MKKALVAKKSLFKVMFFVLLASNTTTCAARNLKDAKGNQTALDILSEFRRGIRRPKKGSNMEDYLKHVLTELHNASATSGELFGKGPFPKILRGEIYKFKDNNIKNSIYRTTMMVYTKAMKIGVSKSTQAKLLDQLEITKKRLRSADANKHKAIDKAIAKIKE